MKSIVGFFAREHLFGNLITILVILFGLYSLFAIRRDIWPKVELHVTSVSTILPGASPEQIEKLVINPVEAAIKEVDGLKKINSKATESTGVVVIQLDKDSRDPDKTNEDIQRVIDQIDDLPEDATKPVITIVDSGVIPVIEVTLSGGEDPFALREAAKVISDELSFMPGVARVVKQGYLKKEFLVEASPEKLAARNVPLRSLIASIAARNQSLPGGSVINNEGRETIVRTEGQYKTANELENTYLVANDSGFGTQLKEVATVRDATAEPEIIYRSNGENSINMVISKKENYDVLKLVGELKEKVTDYSESFGNKFHIGTSNDFSVYLRTRIKALSSNLIIGLLLVLIILTLFLPWQVTLVVAVGIPIALLSAIIAVYLAGLSLNLISLMGLIIVLGMLVDDAIVVSENIWRHVEEGDDIVDSVITGTNEVFGPVFASILTTISAFGPMLFMTGIFGAFVYQIPMMVILALIFSLLEAFLIMPSHFVSWVGPFIGSIKERKRAKETKKKTWFDRLTQRYKIWVAWSLRYRYRALGIVGFIFVGSIGLMAATGKFVLFPSEDAEIFFVQLEGDRGVALERMAELVEPVEKQIMENVPSEDLLDIVTHVGIIQQDMMDPLTRRGAHYANIRVTLTPQSERLTPVNDIIEVLRNKVEVPKEIEKVDFELVQQGPPQGRDVSMNIKGKDFDTLRKIAGDFKDRLAALNGVKDIRDSYQIGKEEWQVIPKYDAASYGLTATDIAQTVRASFEGIVASSVRSLDEEIDIRVKLKKREGDTLEQLSNLKVGNNQGNLVQLPAIADFEKSQSVSYIGHSKFKRVINVSAAVDEEKTSALAVNDQVRPILDDLLKEYPGYTYESSGEDADTKESMQSLLVAFLFAACFIFSLLIITFRNLFQPMLILTSIPLGFIGVIWAMFIHGRPFSFMAMLGVIALAGVIVNNAIVFTDFVNSARKRGKNLNDSIVEAAGIRLRPIILTSITTICGLLPTAYGDKLKYIISGVTGFLENILPFLGTQLQWLSKLGGGDPFVIPIALALGWGLGFGSVLTGLFFPAFIRIMDDIMILADRVWKKIRSKRLSAS